MSTETADFNGNILYQIYGRNRFITLLRIFTQGIKYHAYILNCNITANNRIALQASFMRENDVLTYMISYYRMLSILKILGIKFPKQCVNHACIPCNDEIQLVWTINKYNIKSWFDKYKKSHFKEIRTITFFHDNTIDIVDYDD